MPQAGNASPEGSASPGRAENGSSSYKRRRITRACDRCHRSGIKCAPSPDPKACEPCSSAGIDCTYNRPVKRRGPAARSRLSHDTERSQPPALAFDGDNTPSSAPWTYQEVAPQSVLLQLASAYHDIIYPISAFYHFPSLMSKILSLRYTHDRAFYASLMALCALTLARLRDGACTFRRDFNPAEEALRQQYTDYEVFYRASVGAIPKDLTSAGDFDYKRAKAVLCLLCIQVGDGAQCQKHLHEYLLLSALDGFHLEARWPEGLSEIQIQERRRLFWATYQLDVYVAVTWGGTIRQRESEATVLYPAEVHDDSDITPDGVMLRRNPGTTAPPFMRGWNCTTDLYRVLEHATVRMRKRRQLVEADGIGRVSSLVRRDVGPSCEEVLAEVGALYNELPEEFRKAEPMSGDNTKDRIGFQAVNLMITMQTVKMVLAGTIGGSNVMDRVGIAGHLLDAISNVPTAYIQAISVSTLHHLAGVGNLLGSAIQSPLSQWQYLQVRNALLSLADLLAGLESSLHRTAGIATKLKAHVERIDRYMAEAAAERSRSGQIYHGVTPSSWQSSEARLDPPKVSPSNSASTGSTQPFFSIPASNDQSPLDPALLNESKAKSLPSADVGETAPAPVGDQVMLPDDLFADWPFDLGQGGAFDFLGMTTMGNGDFLDVAGPSAEDEETARALEILGASPEDQLRFLQSGSQ